MKRSTFPILRFCTVLLAISSHGGLSGHNTKGDFGLQSGTQPPVGFYVIPLFVDYQADTFRDKNGDRFSSVDDGRAVKSRAAVLGLTWVFDKKVFGGDYSFSVWPGVTNNALEFPPLRVDESVSTGFTDLYIRPISVGWNRDRADFVAGIGIYAPTGEYEEFGDNNRGLGMWTFELFGGATVYLDEAKTWHFATLAQYETHGKKDGTDVRVGDFLTLEGGLGKSFMDGALSVGVSYYAQWKLTDDDFGLAVPAPVAPVVGKNRVYGFGPEVNIPLASQKKLFGFLNLRYFWETGARSTLEGNTFVATLTFPVPSIPLQ